jgi:PRELI-like family
MNWDNISSPTSSATVTSFPIQFEKDLFPDSGTKRVNNVSHIYNYPFRTVVHAYFTKFNDMKLLSVNSSLEKIETLMYHESVNRNLVYRKRHIFIKTPSIISFAYWQAHLIFEEESWCDYENQILQFKTINISAQDIATVTEHSKLYVDAQTPNKTNFLELAGIRVKMSVLDYPLTFFLDQQGRESAKQSIMWTEKALLKQTTTTHK